MDKKIVLVGAGSTSFGFETLTDLYFSKILDGSTIVLHDIDKEKLDTLENRQKNLFPELLVKFIPGDVNANVSLILKHIPKRSRNHTVLTFCLVDLYNLSNLHFNTIS